MGVVAVGALLVVPTSTPASAQTTSTTSEPYSGQREPTEGPQGTEPPVQHETRIDIVGGLLIGAPIYDGDFADPFALHLADAVYLYATNTTTANIPVLKLTDGRNSTGEYLGDALPALPAWTTKGSQWAPSVWARPDGTFVLHYSTRDTASGKQCISAATGANPAGPFSDTSTQALICPLDQGGAIDPSIFIDVADAADTPYLLWKSDGNCCSLPTVVYSQQLAADGLSIAGPPSQLITADQGWEGDLVEGPSMVLYGSTYYLFYSANNWNSTSYAIGVALCSSVKGPCTKPQDRPWESSQGLSRGPGGQEFFNSTGGVWMVRHGWLPGEAGTPDGQRRLYLDLLKFDEPGAVPTRIGASYVAVRLLPYVLAAIAVVAALVVLVLLFVRRRRAARRGRVTPA